jgi:hypothetical protein
MSAEPRLAIVLDDGARELKIVGTLADRELLRAAAWSLLESAYQRAAEQPSPARAAFQKLDAVALYCTLLQHIPDLQDCAMEPLAPLSELVQ